MKACVSIAGTLAARTVRSGSDTVMSVPMKKETRMTTQIFRDFVIVEPTCSPIGVMDLSTPSVKSPMPKIIINVPARKEMKIEFGSGVTVKDSARMIKDTGRTDARDSLSFSIKMVLFFIVMQSFLYCLNL